MDTSTISCCSCSNVKRARRDSKGQTQNWCPARRIVCYFVVCLFGKHARDGQEFMYRSAFPGWCAIDSVFTAAASSASRRNSIANKNKKLAELGRFLPVPRGYIDGVSETHRPIYVYTAMPVGDSATALFRFSQPDTFIAFEKHSDLSMPWKIRS
jgi:hypothetical protein